MLSVNRNAFLRDSFVSQAKKLVRNSERRRLVSIQIGDFLAEITIFGCINFAAIRKSQIRDKERLNLSAISCSHSDCCMRSRGISAKMSMRS